MSGASRAGNRRHARNVHEFYHRVGSDRRARVAPLPRIRQRRDAPGCRRMPGSRTMSIVHRIHLGLFACALLLACVAAPGAAQSDADFLAARTAFERGDRARLDALAPKLATHVLQPYVAYWQLKLRLDSARDEEVKAFLARWGQTPLADRLRADWLKSLGKRGQWGTFGSEYSPQPGEDVELACYAIQYRRQSEGDAALKAARPLWFTDKATPDSCDPLFAALIAKNVITVEDRRARFRLAVEAGNVRVAQAIAVDLPPADRIAAQRVRARRAQPVARACQGRFSLEAAGRARPGALRAGARCARRCGRRARRMGAAAKPIARCGSAVRQRADRLSRVAPVESAGARVVSRGRRRRAVRRAARLADPRGASCRRVARRARDDRRHAAGGSAGARLAVLEGARADGSRTGRGSDCDLRGARRRSRVLRAALGGSAGQAARGDERAARSRARSAGARSARAPRCNGS